MPWGKPVLDFVVITTLTSLLKLGSGQEAGAVLQLTPQETNSDASLRSGTLRIRSNLHSRNVMHDGKNEPMATTGDGSLDTKIPTTGELRVPQVLFLWQIKDYRLAFSACSETNHCNLPEKCQIVLVHAERPCIRLRHQYQFWVNNFIYHATAFCEGGVVDIFYRHDFIRTHSDGCKTEAPGPISAMQ